MKYEVKSILFLGVGGISMHQLAIAIKKMGVKVFGYDLSESRYTHLCEENGIKVVHRYMENGYELDIYILKAAAPKDHSGYNYKNNRTICFQKQ